MYFEVNITPKEKAAPVHVEPETRFSLLLAPFQPQIRITIETALNTTGHAHLGLRNTSKRPLIVQVTKKPPPERLVVLSFTKLNIEPEQEVNLVITWTARQPGTSRDIIQLTDNRRIKYDVVLTTSTLPATRNGAANKLGGYKLSQSPENWKKILAENTTGKLGDRKPSLMHENQKNKPESKRVFNFTENITDNLNSPSKGHKLSYMSQYEGKENVASHSNFEWHTPKRSSSSPLGYRQDKLVDISTSKIRDFSMLIESDTFALTPPAWFRNDKTETPFSNPSYTALLSPPKAVPQALRRETYVTAPFCKNSTFTNDDTVDHFEDSLSPRETKLPKNSDFSLLINGINFATTNTPNVVLGEKYHKTEYNFGTPTINQNTTFEVLKSSNLEDSFQLPTGLPKLSDSHHLAPTRLSRNFATISPVMPVIEPRVSEYATSSSPICGNETEEPGLNLRTKFESHNLPCRRANMDTVQEVLEADLWVKPMGQHTFGMAKNGAVSLESIQEEMVKTPATNKTYIKSLNETHHSHTSNAPVNQRLDFSPPNSTVAKKTSPIRKISPKKYTKVIKERNVHEIQGLKRKATMNTSWKSGCKVSIPGVRITKLSLAGMAQKRVINVPNKGFENEVSMKLHNPDDFFTRLCNPDPFAATTTEDPFLASSLYYDDKWVKNQALEFKKWLNALLTPPEHLTSNVDTPFIDVAKVWQSCRLKEDVSLAETKEAVSARYHTNQRLNTLRRAACTMLRCNEVVSVLSKITVCVEKGILVIRQDRDLHKDIGLQKLVLELLLCYNPLWLRIGLEAIYGETIPLHSNNDIIRLSKFLLARFFSDPYIVKTHSHQTVVNLRLPSFFAVMNKFMLKKFLFIVYFLDYAKSRKLIGHDPCLFHKQAAYKESKRILLKFSQELLSGVGDVTRVVKPYGYILTHKQTELDEYTYAVDNLSLDLRDGVRLCRVMELITGKRNLTAICRVPAISRLQKVYNVDVALKALTSSGYVLCGNITAKCIADGHKEKTLSLLWQIIYKFQAPHFNKAAATVQNWWRAKLWWIRVRNYLRQRKVNAACVIQRVWRSYLARKELRSLRENRMRVLATRNQAAKVIQIKWIATVKMQQARRLFLRRKSSAAIIQTCWKNYRATKPFVETLKRKRAAASVIQLQWRATNLMRLQVSRYLILRDAVNKMQRWWKRKLLEKAASDTYQALRKATRLVQNKWRANRMMKIQRQEYLRKLHAVKVIQEWWRSKLTCRKDRNNFILKKDAVLSIENWWLHCSVSRKLQAALNKDTYAVIVLQQRWRARQKGRCQRQAFLKLRNSVVSVQRRWRAIRIARSVRQNYVLKRTASTIIQSYWRNWRIGFEQRCLFLSLKAAAMCVQDRFRANKATHVAYTEFNMLKRSTIVVQRRWTATRIARQDRLDFLAKRNAAVVLQSNYRAIIAARKYRAKKEAAIKIQLHWKAYQTAKKTRASFALLKSSTIFVQRKYRAKKIANFVRKQFLTLKIKVLFIEQKWRDRKLMQQCREVFLRKRQAANKIQAWWKARLMMKTTKMHYDVLRSATISIQQNYRARKIGTYVRQEFQTLKSTVIFVQQKWRANKLMQLARKDFLRRLQATKIIQAWWKSCLTTKKTKSYYNVLKSTTIFVQQNWRAQKLAVSVRKEFLILKANVIYVQQKWQANKLMRLYQEDFLTKRRAVIKIQIWWRTVRAGRICQENYRKQKTAAIEIQRWYRSVVCARIMQESYNKRVNSAIIIQNWWRVILSTRQRIRQRKASAATIIQAIWRGHKIRQSQSQEMTKLRERSEKANMEAQPSETLGHRLNIAINIVQEYENLGKLTQGLTALDTITHLLPQGCIALCNADLVVKLYDLLHRSNRSRPWMDICHRASSILVSIVKYSPTKSYVWQEKYIETIVRLLSATAERETSVFLNLATLLWLLADTPSRIKTIAECPTSVRSLAALQNIVSRKKTRLSVGPKLPFTQTCMLPNPKPDWGLKHSRPRLFTSVHHAVVSLCKRLKIKTTQ